MVFECCQCERNIKLQTKNKMWVAWFGYLLHCKRTFNKILKNVKLINNVDLNNTFFIIYITNYIHHREIKSILYLTPWHELHHCIAQKNTSFAASIERSFYETINKTYASIEYDTDIFKKTQLFNNDKKFSSFRGTSQP